MRKANWLAVTSVLVAASGGSVTPSTIARAAQASSYQAHANLAQMMRGIPFPNANIVFDTQIQDPEAPKPPSEVGRGATAAFASVYGGWQQVENSALAIAESANLMLIPGRSCSNGRPVPLDQADFQQFAKGLADAGLAAYRASQTKSLDAMVKASGVVAGACAACHEVYRDKKNPKDRCIP
jgi:hypothetical protein